MIKAAGGPVAHQTGPRAWENLTTLARLTGIASVRSRFCFGRGSIEQGARRRGARPSAFVLLLEIFN